jgi:hypothetical protein
MMSFLARGLGLLLALAVFCIRRILATGEFVGVGIAAECHAGGVRALIAGLRHLPKITRV